MSSPNETGTGERSPLLVQDSPAAAAASSRRPSAKQTKPSSSDTPGLPKADTNSSWPPPAGLHPRGPNDENVQIFRRAVGINSNLSAVQDAGSLEEGRKTAVGIYLAVIRESRTKHWQFFFLNVLIYACHFLQIAIGAGLTALGPVAQNYGVLITGLGAANTVIAGTLALIKGQGLPERLGKDELEFHRLQDWIEETEALLAVGVVGKDRKEVGMLVEVAFKKYNAAKASAQNNKPDSYVRQAPEGERDGDDAAPDSDDSSGNAIVRLNIPGTM